MKKLCWGVAAVLLVAGAVPAIVKAAPADSSVNQPVQLQPGVARVSFIHGDVTLQHGDSGQWVPATLNTPVVEGDRVATGQHSRAELQLDWADVLRMSDEATATVAKLNRDDIQVQVGEGLTTYSVLESSGAASEIDTPNASIRPSGPGEYRILVNSNAETQVIVRSGSAEISTPQGSTQVGQGQMITVAGTQNAEYKTDPAPASDEWDAWNNQRNQRITSAESWRYTDRYYTGSQDLDAYGRWSDVPGYGPVWIPRQRPGWAPYRVGRWVYEPYYGWTWVSYEPWGWAPYHYGRWFVWGGDWVWWPGPVVLYPAYYPIWAPAYVNFFGFGGGGWGVNFGFAFGFGGFGRVGWLPCGPGDWYRPWYGRWGRNFRAFHVGDRDRFRDGFAPLRRGDHAFSNMGEALRNNRVRGGFSWMAGNRFGRDPVRVHQAPISKASFHQANVFGGRIPMRPTRESFSPTGRAANMSAFRHVPPNSQRFFSRAPRSNARPNANAGRSFAGANRTARGQTQFGSNRTRGALPRSAPAPGRLNANRGISSTRAQSSRPGWHTFTSQHSESVNRTQRGFTGNRGAPNNARSARPGWHTFSGSRAASNRSTRGFGANRSSINNSNRGGFANRRGQSRIAAGPRSRSGNRGDWHHFTPSSRSAQPRRQGGRAYAQPRNNSQRSQFHPFTAAPRGTYSNNNRRSHSRPPLDMRQPIVRPRNRGYGGPRGGRSYNQSRGGNSGGYRAPRGGRGYSGPRGGGGNYRGGGGRRGGGSHGGGAGRGHGGRRR